MECGNVWTVEEKPLPSLVLEARFVEPNFHDARRMENDFGDVGLTTSAVLSPHPFTKVLLSAWALQTTHQNTRPDGVPPREVTQTVLGRVEGKGGDVIWID